MRRGAEEARRGEGGNLRGKPLKGGSKGRRRGGVVMMRGGAWVSEKG